jgi:hypothetical protein
MSKVILSKKTLDVLKNFASINSSIVFRKGSTVRTISNAEDILAKYTAEEVFPVDFAIYDLGQFLSGITLFNDPQLEFSNNDYVSIRGGGRSAKYYFSDPEITLKSAPEKNVKFPGADIQFNITCDELMYLQKASAVYSLPDLTFQSVEDENTIKLILRDKENDTSNTYEQSISGCATGSYSLDVKIENIRLLLGDYTVKISKHLISEWTNQITDLTYYIALEP